MSEGEKTEVNTFVKGYCVYKHMTNNPLPTANESCCPKSVPKVLAEMSTLCPNFSLSLLLTDLKPEQELPLQDFLIKRLFRNNMYNNSTGSIATLSNSDIAKKPVMCFFKLIRGSAAAQKESDAEATYENEDLSRPCSQGLLLCFVASEEKNLYLFQQELEAFCKGYENSLETQCKMDKKPSEIFKDIDDWYDINISYVSRCVKFLNSHLATVINIGLVNQSLAIEGCDERCKEDIQRFVSACSLSNLLSIPLITDSNCELLKQLYLKQKEVNTLRVAESTFNFDLKLNEEVCDTCKNWANTMTGGNQNDPIFLRQVMENYKLKVIQDMNSLKRLLREAEADHYALFKAFVFLTKCPSSPIVMWHIRMEALVSMPRSICYVIAVLDEFITDKGGFAKIRARPAMP